MPNSLRVLWGDHDVAATVPYLRCLLRVPSEAQGVVAGRQGRDTHAIDHVEVEPPAPECRFLLRAPVALATPRRTETIQPGGLREPGEEVTHATDKTRSSNRQTCSTNPRPTWGEVQSCPAKAPRTGACRTQDWPRRLLGRASGLREVAGGVSECMVCTTYVKSRARAD